MPLGQGLRVFLRRCIINQDGSARKLLCDRPAGPARRSRNEGGLSLKLLYGAGPHLVRDDSTSQSPDPILKALYLHHNHIGIVSAVRHCSHTLKGAKEMHSEFS